MNIIYKLFGGLHRKWQDMRDGTHAPTSLSHPPFDLLTDGGDGPSRRLRVDSAQTGFFAGREFRTFRRLNLAQGAEFIIKFTTPIDIILHKLVINLTQGEAEIATEIGGTEGGTFATPLPIIGRNTMSERPSPFYNFQASINEGGTLAGSTEIDVIMVKSADNSNFAGNVSTQETDERGVSAGSYYFRVKNTGDITAIGVINAWWEERPAGIY